MAYYLLIPRLVIQKANAAATPWLISPLPIFAAAMLGHALGDDGGEPVTGVSYLHHNAQLLAEMDLPKAGKQVFPHQFRGASFIDKEDYSSKNKYALSLQPTFSAHLVVSVVLRFDQAPDVDAIIKSLEGRRLAGGEILRYGTPFLSNSLTGEKGILSKLKNGFLTLDRTSLLANEDNLIGGFLKQVHEPIAEPNKEGEPKTPWRSSTVLGYSMITDFQQRTHVRDNLEHAFAEPLVGLVDLVSIRQSPEKLASSFWQWGWPHDNTFLLTQ